MADGKVKATLMPRGIFRWQRFPFVPIKHSPQNHLQVVTAFPGISLYFLNSESIWMWQMGRVEKNYPEWEVSYLKVKPTELKLWSFSVLHDWSHLFQRPCFHSNYAGNNGILHQEKIWEAKTGGSRVWGQPGLYRESMTARAKVSQSIV